MKRNEAILLVRDMSFGEIYLAGNNCSRLDEVKDNFNFDELINYFESLNIPYEVMRDFVSGDIEFDLISGEHSEDDFDNITIYRNKDDSLGMYAWTEVFGNCYDLKDYGIKWTERRETAEEIKEREEREKRWKEESHETWKEFCRKLTAAALPDLVDCYKEKNK